MGERRSALEGARDALEDFASVVGFASAAELAELMELVDAVAAKAGAARAVVTVEAVGRGEVAPGEAHGWVREHAPALRQGGAGDVAKLACRVAPKGALWRGQGEGARPDPESALGVLWDGVTSGEVSPRLAGAALRELGRVDPHLEGEEVRATVMQGLLALGVPWGTGAMRTLRPAFLAKYGVPGALDDLQDRLKRAAKLSLPVVESGDLTQYELWMTPEQAGVLEAAIGPLSAPAPNEETGERDLRSAGQRRVEALSDVCRRFAAADADERGGADGAAGSGAAVHVIMDLDDLRDGTGSGEVAGSTATGVILSPGVVRRLACAAALVPHVLGTAGEALDVGRVARLFSRAQRRALLRRDRGCTYPGCTAPAAWTQAHHVVHWLDGGETDLDNAALLCQRHHTIVHDRRYVAAVRENPDEGGRFVVWERTHGSYDRHLERLRAERAVADPRPLTPARVAELVAAIQVDDPHDAYWAKVELDHERDEHEQWRQSLEWAALRADMPPDEPDPAFSYPGNLMVV